MYINQNKGGDLADTTQSKNFRERYINNQTKTTKPEVSLDSVKQFGFGRGTKLIVGLGNSLKVATVRN